MFLVGFELTTHGLVVYRSTNCASDTQAERVNNRHMHDGETAELFGTNTILKKSWKKPSFM